MKNIKSDALCHHCHTCGHPLKSVLDGESYCPICKEYRRYRTHGWTHALADKSDCLTSAQRWWAEQQHYDLSKPIPF